uniref:Putative 5.3 kDa protein n=1 Tax=Ixodes ricinus TaxID=34613 RepID=A0A0K8RKJ9_IXORI
MRVLIIFIATLLLLGSFCFVESAPPKYRTAQRPKCEIPCRTNEQCKRPCVRCDNTHPWSDLICKMR